MNFIIVSMTAGGDDIFLTRYETVSSLPSAFQSAVSYSRRRFLETSFSASDRSATSAAAAGAVHRHDGHAGPPGYFSKVIFLVNALPSCSSE